MFQDLNKNVFVCRVEELKHLVEKTEAEEKHQAEKYVRALKEGEKALEEKTAQLARTRNELQTQMTQFHEVNSKINKLRTELGQVQGNVKKGKDEVERLSQRREEERRLQERHVKVSWNDGMHRVSYNYFRFCHCCKNSYSEVFEEPDYVISAVVSLLFARWLIEF